MSLHPGQAASSFSLDCYSGKVQIRDQINTALSELLAILIPCLEDSILPMHYNGHFLTSPRQNCRQDRHPGCTQHDHQLSMPNKDLLITNQKFTTLSERDPKSRQRPVQTIGEYTPDLSPLLATDLAQIPSMPPQVLGAPSCSPPAPSMLLPTALQTRLVADNDDDNMDIIPGLNCHYKAPTTPTVAPHYSPDGSVISISSTSTANDDAATVISISSNSSSSVGVLRYPLNSDMVYDILTPVRLVVFVNVSAIAVAVDLNVYLEYTNTWTSQMWEIGIPITCPNRAVFIRSYKAISADIDGFFNTLF
ncbi:hypothetical protein B0H13DRAFT_1862107 [Mycena leptocephala]|nr:hypothetical protein B0H13DRAFT_1862107 [Mycena leptocephala]